MAVFSFATGPSFAQQYKFSKMLLPDQIAALDNLGATTEILEDHLGFIWIGTQNGLYKFDGYSTTHYLFDPNHPEKLAGNWISGLTEDDSGNIWMGIFGTGLQKLDPLTDEFTLYKPSRSVSEGLCSDKIEALTFFKNKLWISTQDGMCCFSSITKQFKTYSNSKRDRVLLILKDNTEPWFLRFGNGYSELFGYNAADDNFTPFDTLHTTSTSMQPISFLKDQLFLNIDGWANIYFLQLG